MDKEKMVLETRAGRFEAALQWITHDEGPFEYKDPVPVAPSPELPHKEARTWLAAYLKDRISNCFGK